MMKAIILWISLILLVYAVLEKSGTLRLLPVKTKEGTIEVEKTRLEWHPERLVPYLKQLYQKGCAPVLKKGREWLRGLRSERVVSGGRLAGRHHGFPVGRGLSLCFLGYLEKKGSEPVHCLFLKRFVRRF